MSTLRENAFSLRIMFNIKNKMSIRRTRIRMTKSKEYMQEDDVVTYIRKVDWNLGIRAKKEMT